MDMMNLISMNIANTEMPAATNTMSTTAGSGNSAFGQVLAASLATTDLNTDSNSLMANGKDAGDVLANLLSGLSNEELITLMTLLDKNRDLNLEDAIMELLIGSERELVDSTFGDLATMMNMMDIKLGLLDQVADDKHLASKLSFFSKSESFVVDSFQKYTDNLLVEKLNQLKVTHENLIQVLSQATSKDNSESLKDMVAVLKNLLAKFEQEALGRTTNEKAEKFVNLNMTFKQALIINPKEEVTVKQQEETKVDVKADVNLVVESKGKDNETANQHNSSNSNSDKGQASQTAESSKLDMTNNLQTQNPTNKVDGEVKEVKSEARLTYTNANDFQKQVEEMVVKQAKLVTKPNGIQTMVINMQPAHLGALKLQVIAENGQITTHITAESSLTKNLLENTISNLRLALVNSGIQVDRIEVQQNNVSPSVQQTNNAQFSQFNQQRQNQDHHEEEAKKNKNLGRFSVEELEELAMEFIDENELDRNFSQDKEAGNMVNITV